MTLERCIKTLIIKQPFYGVFLLGIERSYGNECNTACVYKKGINVAISVNEEYWNGLTDEEQMETLMHEVGHILYKHMFMVNDFPDHGRLNIAADCEINSDLPTHQKVPYCYPARWGLPNHLGTKNYYDQLPDNIKSPDNHDSWKDFQGATEGEKKLINNQIDYHAKSTAEHMKKIGAPVPSSFKDYIDSLFEQKPQVFNWKAYFRKLIGYLATSELFLTRLRPSRRFDGGRGVRFKRKAKVLVAMDTSGSISKGDLEDFLSEITYLYKSGVGVDLAQVDTEIRSLTSYTGKFNGQIVGRGGTHFESLFNYYISHKSEYSALVVFTDGYVCLDLPKVLNCVWVISGGYKQNYPGTTVYIPN